MKLLVVKEKKEPACIYILKQLLFDFDKRSFKELQNL